MFHLVKSEVVPLTPDVAKEFRDLEPSPTEREVSPSRVKHLREKAVAGHLISFQWSKANFENKTIRMNGQHSSTMLCDLNGHFPEGLYAHIDTYSVDTPADLALLFRQFDDRKSSRTPADVSGAYQGLVPELADIHREIAALGVKGYAWYLRFIEGITDRGGDDIYDYFNREAIHEYLHWLNDLFDIKTPEMQRIPVVAAMYGTFIKSEAGARAFWSQVARGGAQYEDQHPTTVLDAWLKAAKETNPADRVRHGLNLKPGSFYNGCIWAWNAFRMDKTIKDIRHDTSKGMHTIAD